MNEDGGIWVTARRLKEERRFPELQEELKRVVASQRYGEIELAKLAYELGQSMMLSGISENCWFWFNLAHTKNNPSATTGKRRQNIFYMTSTRGI